MTARIEWRSRDKGDDALLLIGDRNGDADTVLKAWRADSDLLADFLNDMQRLDRSEAAIDVKADQQNPQQWGKLVLARAQDGGDILNIDPEPYWDGIYYWFRAHGWDPHRWRGRQD